MTKNEFTKLFQQHGAEELAKNFVFPVKLSAQQKKTTDEDLSKALASRRAGMSKDEKLKATLMQFRFQMEDYLRAQTNIARAGAKQCFKKSSEKILKKKSCAGGKLM